MNKLIKSAMATLVVVAAVASTGCAAIDRLEERAVADRAQNPEKYQEIAQVKREQMTANQGGMAYPEFCTNGCPEIQTDLTRNW